MRTWRTYTVFEDLIGVDEEDANQIASHFSELWDMVYKLDVIEQVLEHDIAIAIRRSSKTIIQFKADLQKDASPRGREVLNRLMPKVFQAMYTAKRCRVWFI